MKRVYNNKKVVGFNADKVYEVSAEEGSTRVATMDGREVFIPNTSTVVIKGSYSYDLTTDHYFKVFDAIGMYKIDGMYSVILEQFDADKDGDEVSITSTIRIDVNAVCDITLLSRQQVEVLESRRN